MIYLAQYRTHQSVEELKQTEQAHIKHSKLTGNVRNVFSYIVSRSFGNLGACKLRSQTIADNLGISRSTVTRCIKKLKDSHVIAVHNDTKGNGIQGANIYAIIFLTHSEPPNESPKLSHQETHEIPRSSKVEHVKHESESLSFNLSFNPSVNKNVNYVTAHGESDLKLQLRNIYQPVTVEGNQAFEELCKIAFGRLKQYMKSHQVPYTQMEQIVLKAMSDLVRKQGVRNQFAMYSKMVERQTLQLFEQHIKPKSTTYNFGKKVGVVPDWFEKGEHMDKKEKPLSESEKQYFEEQRKKLLAELGA